MAESGGQPGNNNATKAKPWANALEKELTGDANAKKLRKIARKVVAEAGKGNMWAIKEIGDRLDGKPHQSIDQTTDLIIITKNSEEVPFTGIREKAEKTREKVH